MDIPEIGSEWAWEADIKSSQKHDRRPSTFRVMSVTADDAHGLIVAFATVSRDGSISKAHGREPISKWDRDRKHGWMQVNSVADHKECW
jgi:hypothetical protein